MSDLRCRCCNSKLDIENVSFPLNVKEASDGMSLGAKLTECIPEMNINDQSKEVICVSCYAQLTSAYNFRKMCLKTSEKFVKIEQKSSIKRKSSIKQKSSIEHNSSIEQKSLIEQKSSIEKKSSIEEKSSIEHSIEHSLTCNKDKQNGDWIVSLYNLPERVLNYNNTLYVCESCKSLFLWEENYKKHISKGLQCFGKCFQCNVNFRSNVIFQMHMKFMHSQRYTSYKLENPNESPPLITELIESDDENLKKTYSEKKEIKILPNKERFICVICRKTFMHMSQLLRHNYRHKTYCYQCRKCKKFEINKYEHFNNTKCQSVNFIDPVFTNTRCPYCFKHLPSVSALDDHLKCHDSFKKYCFKCHMNFITMWEMALHHILTKCYSTQFLNQCLEESPNLNCPMCQKKFHQKKNLRAHFMIHCFNTTVCNYCDKPFYNKSAFSNHSLYCDGSLSVENNKLEMGTEMGTEMGMRMETEMETETELVCVKEESLSFFESEDSGSGMKEEEHLEILVDPFAESEMVVTTEETPQSSSVAKCDLAKDIGRKLQDIMGKMKHNELPESVEIVTGGDVSYVDHDKEIEDAVNSIISLGHVDNEKSNDKDLVTSTT